MASFTPPAALSQRKSHCRRLTTTYILRGYFEEKKVQCPYFNGPIIPEPFWHISCLDPNVLAYLVQSKKKKKRKSVFVRIWLLTLWRLTTHYSGRTAPLTSKRFILYIYSTNIRTEYFKRCMYSPFFSSSKCSLFHNSSVFGSCIIDILYTGCAKI